MGAHFEALDKCDLRAPLKSLEHFYAFSTVGHMGQKFFLMQPKFPSTFSACYTSKISLAMPIYDQKLKSTKDFG